MFSASIVAVLLCIIVTNGKQCDDPRKEELARMKEYELIYFNLDRWQSDNIIEFDAFKQHYVISLTADETRIANNLRHTNGIPTDHSQRYYTSLTHSCHYTGPVLNSKNDRDLAALSLCTKRGVRGSVHSFNETLYIKPSKYYLDLEFDSKNYHSLTDEHLVFRMSDLDTTGLPQPQSMQLDATDAKTPPKKQKLHTKVHGVSAPQMRRRRMANYNAGKSMLEMLVIVDPIRTDYYETTYGDAWYEQMVSAMQDFIAGVSAEYQKADWGTGNSIKTVTVHMVELEVVFEFNGVYADLRPQLVSTDTVSGNDYLEKLTSWIGANKDVSTFDNVQLWTDYSFGSSAGVGWVGTVCTGSYSSSTVAMCCGDTWAIRTATHELGHNFDMNHDGQGDSICHEDAGLMGYGDGEGFSTCSKKSMRDYYSEKNGLTCLGDGVRGFTSNHGGDGGSQTPAPTERPTSDEPTKSPIDEPTKAPTPEPTRSPIAAGTPTSAPVTPSPTDRPTAAPVDDSTGTGDCVGMVSFDVFQGHIDYNGYWPSTGSTFNDLPCYSKDGYYMFYNADYRKWWIGDTIANGGYGYAHCPGSDDVSTCAGDWNYYAGTGTTGWVQDTDVVMYDCTNNAGDEDTDQDTDNGEVVDPGCDYLSCVRISSFDATYLNGDYEPRGCRDNKGMYQNGDYYFYWSSGNGLWMLYNEITDSTAYAICREDDVIDCTNKLQYYDGGWVTDTTVYVTDDCDGGAFTEGDDCDNKYSDELCISNYRWNASLWTEYEGACSHNTAVFSYKWSNESTYYLWYDEVIRYSDSNETFGQWYITENEIGSKASQQYAYCEESDLLECTKGHWNVKDESFGDMIQFDLDEGMYLHEDMCGSDLNENDDDGRDAIVAVIVVVSLISIAVMLVVLYFCVYKKRSQTKNFEFTANDGIKNNQKFEVPDHDEGDLDGHANTTRPEAVAMTNNNKHSSEIEVEIEV